MAGLTDFLFQGQAPPQATSYSSTSANLPDWFSAAAQGLIARSNAIASEPFQQYQGPRIAGFDPMQSQAYNNIGAQSGAWQPQLGGALNMVQQAGNTDSLAAAQPLLNQSSQTFPGAVDQYMSPYQTQVTDRIAEIGNRNLTENLLPQLQDRFIAAGHPGSNRAADFAGRAVRDVGGEIAAQQGQFLNQGYQQAGTLFNQDQSRLGTLAQLTGQLTSDTAGRQLAAGQQTGALAQTQQQLGLTDAAALEGAGLAQQGQQQRNLDLAYQNFAEQRDYPRQNVAFLNEALRGAAPAAQPSTTTTSTGPASSFGASPLAQVAGAGLSAVAIKSLLNKKEARGGAVVPMQRGGWVPPGYARGGALMAVNHGR